MNRLNESTRTAILELLQARPRPSTRQIADLLNVSKSTVANVAAEANLRLDKPRRPNGVRRNLDVDDLAASTSTADRTLDVDMDVDASENVDAAMDKDADADAHMDAADPPTRFRGQHLDDAETAEADGLEEYLPPPTRRPSRPAPRPPQIPHPTRRGYCHECNARWTLDPGESEPTICPKCSADLGRIYECGACHQRWTLDPGEAQARKCPKCGVRFLA